MDSTDSSATAGLPIACTLGPDDGAARMRRWQALSANGHPSARRSGHRIEVRYRPEPGILEELEALAAAERECCAFATWKVSDLEDQVILEIAARSRRSDDIASLAALFGAD